MSPARCRHLRFLLCFLSIFFSPHKATTASTISSNQSLSGRLTIASEGGNFELGFFSPGNSHKFYVGIWYKVSPDTVVWVANREVPLSSSTSAELKIADDGNLVITPTRSPARIWSTNSTTISSNSTLVELLDSGNLVLRDGLNSSRVFWQSFDHHTDTWLPDSTLGLNKVTGKSQLLTSWKNSEDPSPGIYALELEPDGSSQYLIQWNRSRKYWSSGTWNDKNKMFSNVPEMSVNYIYNFEYINTSTENYFNYSVKNNSILTRFVMGTNGQIQQLTLLENPRPYWNLFWSQPREQCDVYSLCGPNGLCVDNNSQYCGCLQGFVQAAPSNWTLGDRTAGCLRRTRLQCDSSKGDRDKFHLMINVRLPENGRIVQVGSDQECESACLSNCSCSAYSFDGRCSLWYSNLINVRQQSDDDGGGGGTLNLRLAASEFPSSKSKKGTVAGAVVGSLVVVSVLVLIILLLVWRKKRNRYRKLKVVEGTLVPFRYWDMQMVTKNFSDKLGQGGFGSVFRGKMPDSTEVAVKKLEGVSQGEKQFRTEVSTIGTIQHVNLVRLRGFCSEGSKRLLVYDYMPKGSLGEVLFQNGSEILSWRTRYQIALGIARGLAYLHEKCRDCIIHCDVKPENILLDDSLVPKVADFGLAKLVGRDFSRVLTTMRGTRGYLAPEWIWGVAITAKADVYSYGMMLFEIISGQRNSEQSDEGNVFFPSWAATKLIHEGDVAGVVDPKVHGDADLEQADRLCRVACWCIQDDEAARPTMGMVVQILEGVVGVNVPPFPQSLRMLSGTPEDVVFFSSSDASGRSSQVPSSTATTSSQSKSTSSVFRSCINDP